MRRQSLFLGSASLLLSGIINYYLRPSEGAQLLISAISVLLSVVLMAILFFIFLKRLMYSRSATSQAVGLP